MSPRYGYPPSHRDHRAPQPETCEVCGLYVEARQLRTLEIDGLRGIRVCHIHPWRDSRPKPDIYRDHPGIQKYVGQSRIYEPGAPEWWLSDPLESIKLVLSDGDQLLIADDLATGFTTWADQKSGTQWSVNGSTTLAVATDSDISDKKSITFTGGATEPLESTSLSWDAADGFTAMVVVKVDSSAPISQDNFLSQVGAPNWLFVGSSIQVLESRVGNTPTLTHSPAVSSRYQILSVRVSSTGSIDLRQDGVQIGSNTVTLSAQTGQIILAGSNVKARSFAGQLAGAVIALSDLGEQDTQKVIGSLKTYYGIFN